MKLLYRPVRITVISTFRNYFTYRNMSIVTIVLCCSVHSSGPGGGGGGTTKTPTKKTRTTLSRTTLARLAGYRMRHNPECNIISNGIIPMHASHYLTHAAHQLTPGHTPSANIHCNFNFRRFLRSGTYVVFGFMSLSALCRSAKCHRRVYVFWYTVVVPWGEGGLMRQCPQWLHVTLNQQEELLEPGGEPCAAICPPQL